MNPAYRLYLPVIRYRQILPDFYDVRWNLPHLGLPVVPIVVDLIRYR